MTIKHRKDKLYINIIKKLKDNLVITVFVISTFSAGLFLIIAVPPFFGYDESHHFYRSYQLSRFDYKPESNLIDDNYRYGAMLPKNLVDLGVRSHIQLAQSPKDALGASNYIEDPAISNLLNQNISKDNTFVAFEGALVYSPVGYTPTIIAIWLGKVINADLEALLIISRLFNLISYILLCVLAIKIAPKKYNLFIGAIALIPMSIFQASSISVDGIVVALSLIIISSAIRLLVRYSNLVFYIALSAAILLALTKPTYLPISMIIPMIYLYLSYKKKSLKKEKIKTLIKTLALILLVFLPMFIWYVATKEYAGYIKNLLIGGAAYAQINPEGQINTIITRPYIVFLALINSIFVGSQGLVMGLFGRLTWDGIWLPLYAVLMNIMYLALVAPTYENLKSVRDSFKFWLFVLLIGASVMLLIYLSLYITFNEVGKLNIGWVQGRYLLPIIPLFILPAYYLFRINIKTRFSQEAIYLVLGPIILLHAIIYYSVTLLI